MNRRLFFTLRMINAEGLLAAAFMEEGRLRVWLGDHEEGVRAAQTFDDGDAASAWLEAQVLRHYPKSAFAKVKTLVAQASALARPPG